MGDTAAGGCYQLPGVAQKYYRVGVFPARVAGREMLADVAVGDGPKHGVGDGVEGNIGVRMAYQTMVMGDSNPTQSDMITGAELMHVEALADTDSPRRRHSPRR